MENLVPVFISDYEVDINELQSFLKTLGIYTFKEETEDNEYLLKVNEIILETTIVNGILYSLNNTLPSIRTFQNKKCKQR